MKAGKLTNEKLDKLVLKLLKGSKSSPRVGEDVAYISRGEDIMSFSVDPISAATNSVGSLSIIVSTNDIAAGGGEPIAILISFMGPEGTKEEEIVKIIKDARKMADKLGVKIIGGHTEITNAVNRIILTTTSIGVGKKKLKGAKKGDYILVTKSIAIEGTVILYEDFLKNKNNLLKEEILEIEKMKESLSVIEEAKVARPFDINSMHDITEGGIVGALKEMVYKRDLGFIIDYEKINIKKSSMKIANHFNIDPLYLISSGSLIITAPENILIEIKNELYKNNIESSIIGRFTDNLEHILVKDGNMINLEDRRADELYKVVK